MFYIFFYPTIYVILTYLVGIVSGFNYSVYSLSFNTLLKTILPYILVIVSGELLRKEVTTKCPGSAINYILLVISLVLVDATLFLTTFDINTGDGVIKFVCNIVMPSVSKNIFLVYISTIAGLAPTIIYRFIMELKMFIIPIVPDFGLYIDSVLSTAYPAILGLIIFISLKQYQNKEVEGKSIQDSKLFTYSIMIVLFLLLTVLVSLTSCKFKYAAIAIGSGSMTGTFNKGDVIIYKAIGDYNPVLDDILVFRKDGKIIVHRIIEVVDIGNDEYIYYTKGDANPTPDGYPLQREDLVGIYKAKIPYLGVPSVYLGEMISNKK
jgi:signal peptidase